MNEEKKVPFKWEFGEETISLQLGMYANNQRLYIGMITHKKRQAMPVLIHTDPQSAKSLRDFPLRLLVEGSAPKPL